MIRRSIASLKKNLFRFHRSQAPPGNAARRWLWRYVALGLASLAWLGVRSGPKPGRLVYPCQRAAVSNGMGFLTYIGALITSMQFSQSARIWLTPKRIGLFTFGVMLTVLVQSEVRVRSTLAPVRLVGPAPALPAWTSPNAVSDVFAVSSVPTPTVSLDGGVIPTGVSPSEVLRDDGMDTLIDLMATHGVKFYRTAQQPEGIIGRDDVVVIKVNNQWNCVTGADNRRSHTNSDVVKGLIYRIVQHPEGFTGAVIVADNSQYVFTQFDCAEHNNAEDGRQSYQDVVDTFVGQSYDVCTYSWVNIRQNFVAEYSSGDVESGYVVVQDGTPGTDQLSYPKFEAICGSQTHQISMRYGLWDGTIYDNTRLKMINLPVVKLHSLGGATIAVKNYIGFLTTANQAARFGDFDDMHNYFWGIGGGSDYGLLGRQLALIRRANLNIVDAIWVNPVSYSGFADSAVRADVLLASTDPFAVDYYTSIYVLLPHLAPDSSAARNADPRYHGGEFRRLLMTNEDRARLKGLTDVIDLDDSFTAPEEEAQFNVFVTDASSPPDATLNLTTEPVSRTVQNGQTAVFTLSPVIYGGYARPVTLTVSDTPPAAFVSIEPNPVIPPGASHLTITTTKSTPAGTYTMTVTGISGTFSDTANVMLNVSVATPDLAFKIFLPIIPKQYQRRCYD